MKRADALAAIYPAVADHVVVTIMGAVAAELYELGHRPGFFYLQHAMGLASSIGLGIALCRPERRVVVLDGDGSLLMNLGTLSTMARHRPGNLLHVVFDNESLLSIGGYPTATGDGADLAAVARGCGVPRVASVATVADFAREVEAALAARELATIVAKVEAVGPPSFRMDLGLIENRLQFARNLRGA